jgi:hypothetical protein
VLWNGDFAEPESVFAEISNPKKRAYLRAMAQTGGVWLAEQLCGVSTDSHYAWYYPPTPEKPNKYYDPAYASAFDRAKRMSLDFRESEVVRRAFHGNDKPIIYQGRITGHYKEYSDILAMFSLNGDMPDKYRPAPSAVNLAPTTINIVEYKTITVNQAPGIEPSTATPVAVKEYK